MQCVSGLVLSLWESDAAWSQLLSCELPRHTWLSLSRRTWSCAAPTMARCEYDVPKACDAGCAAYLLPMQVSCAKFLSSGVLKAMKGPLDIAAAKCPGAH